MPGAAAGEPKGSGAPKGTAQGGATDTAAPRKSPSAFRTVTIALAGAAITGALVGAVVVAGGIGSGSKSSGTSSVSEPTLAKVAPAEIAKAIVTLDPATSQQMVADAKACKAPIAWVLLTKQPGSAGGSVRIRSGTYLSPPFHATDTPQRIAIPYPAPYETGRGVMWAIGEGSGLAIDLYPRWNIPSLNGAAPINVVWTPTDPC